MILTLNEEVNIRDCLASCAWCDDVHVVDSGSTDRTIEVARSMGAKTYEHPFESFGKQRNWAIDNVSPKHEWIFHLDADERFTPDLVREMRERLGASPAESGYHVPNKLMFMGRWLKRAGQYPTYQMRLFHRERMRFEDYGHGQRESTSGKVGTLREPYLHFNFSKGLGDWIDRHNKYSTLEAREALERLGRPLELGRIFGADPVARRRALKDLFYRLPCRAELRFLITLLGLGAILEGQAGRTYARLVYLYEQMITCKLRLLRRHDRGASDPNFEKDVLAGPGRRAG